MTHDHRRCCLPVIEPRHIGLFSCSHNCMHAPCRRQDKFGEWYSIPIRELRYRAGSGVSLAYFARHSVLQHMTHDHRRRCVPVGPRRFAPKLSCNHNCMHEPCRRQHEYFEQYGVLLRRAAVAGGGAGCGFSQGRGCGSVDCGQADLARLSCLGPPR